MNDDRERQYVNASLKRKMPFLVQNLVPVKPDVEFVQVVIEEYRKIKAKSSGLSVSQRKMVTNYVDGFRVFQKQKESEALVICEGKPEIPLSVPVAQLPTGLIGIPAKCK